MSTSTDTRRWLPRQTNKLRLVASRVRRDLGARALRSRSAASRAAVSCLRTEKDIVSRLVIAGSSRLGTRERHPRSLSLGMDNVGRVNWSWGRREHTIRGNLGDLGGTVTVYHHNL